MRDLSLAEDILFFVSVNKAEGNNNVYAWEKPYIEFHSATGQIIPFNDKECCEKYPYASYFCSILNSQYADLKENKSYLEIMNTLNNDLKLCVSKIVERIQNRVCLEDIAKDPTVFEELSGQFPDLKDYLFSQNEYANLALFQSSKRFCKEILGQIEPFEEKEVIEEQYEDIERD